MQTTTEYMAVYGTLKQGEPNHDRWMADTTFVGHGMTKAAYPMLVSGLPYLFFNEGRGKNVSVEVYTLSYAKLLNVDRLEGHPDFYCRKQIPIILDNGNEVMAWTYFINAVDSRVPKNEQCVSNYSHNDCT